MTLLRSVAGVLVVSFALVLGALPGTTRAATPTPVSSASSDSYYRLDVPAGSMSVRVEATVQNSTRKESSTVTLFAMPGLQDLAVTREGDVLPTKVTPLSDADGLPSIVTVTLPAPLKAGARTDLVMTYSVPSQKNDFVNLGPGVAEALFVSQGVGSFVFVDVPAAADNYFDPGCFPVATQPKDVKEAGLQRWVCGDVVKAALYQDLASVGKKCASLDIRCRQKDESGPLSAFAQSITDSSLRGSLEADITLSERTVHLTFRFFRSDAQWAEKQLAVAKAALPLLEEAFGFPYPFEKLSIRQSHHIEFSGAAGVAFDSGGDVLIAPDTGIDEEVTVHELAHQWAGGNVMSGWVAEGLAEYATRTVAPLLSITPEVLQWQKSKLTAPLGQFEDAWDIIETDPDYWYGKAGAFWFEFEKAIGGRANMRIALGQMDDSPEKLPLSGRWFMDSGERVSGANLDDLFLSWVWPGEAEALKTRRAAYNTLAPLSARSVEIGFSGTPKDIQANLDAWTFGPIAGQVKDAGVVLDTYVPVAARATESGLPPTDAVAKAWGTRTLAQIRGVIEDQRQAIKAINESATRLGAAAPDSKAQQQLAEAREKYGSGDFDEAERLAASATTTAFNEVAAAKMIALARTTQAGFKPGFFGRIGMLFADPEADLRRAELAYDGGDHAEALKLSRSAFDAWNEASRRGMERLAVVTGGMSGLFVLVWYLLRRLDRAPNHGARRSRPKGAHSLGDPETRRADWHDWENSG